MWVGRIQSVEGLNQTKSLTLPQVRGNSLSLPAFVLGHWLFPAFRFKRKLHPRLSWAPSLLTTGLGIWCFHNCVGLLLVVNYVCMHYCSVSVENPDEHRR